MIERFNHKGIELALIIRRDYQKDGIEFFTPDEYSQQMGYMKRPVGHVIPPHVHNSVPREVQYTREVLFVKSGSLRVDLYSDAREYVGSTFLEAGDIILLAAGGHGFEMIEETEMIEVKQGPHAGEEDKTRFNGVKPAEIRIMSHSK